MLAFISMSSFATGDQNLVSPLGIKSILGIENTTPSITYNSLTNDYLVVYAKSDISCSNQRLFGVVIDAITGNTVGNVIEISNCHIAFDDVQVLFNSDINEYFFFYKALGNIGNKSDLYYCSIDGTNLTHAKTPTKLVGDAIADPYLDLAIGHSPQSNVYALGYHKVNAQEEYSYTISYLNSNDKSLKPYETIVDKEEFTNTNKGLKGSILVSNGSAFLSVFELKYDSGSEIWGCFHNPSDGTLVNDYFKVSPTAISGKYYINPSAAFVEYSNEVVAVYEQSYFADGGGAYALSDTISVQKINASTGVLTGPSNVSLPSLPGTGNAEDKKLPAISFSTLSNEIIIGYDGIRFAAGTDIYHLYIHRLSLDDLSSISPASTLVKLSMGSAVLNNSELKPAVLSHNSINNQFNLIWYDESGNSVDYQIWRYDNNPPQNLEISNNAIDEELNIGTTIATLSANDPDPEDSTPNFTLIPGFGDNSFFEIQGNELKILKRLSYEEATTRAIKVKAEDAQGKSVDKEFSIAIIDTNEDPFDLSLAAPLAIEENQSPDLFSSEISVRDEDIGDTHSYDLIDGDSSDHNVNFEIITGMLKLKTPVNYEDTSRQYVRIKATDNTGLDTEKAFFIDVLNINEEPTDFTLSQYSIPENVITSMVLEVEDPDINSNYLFTKPSGEPYDNALFDLSGDILKPLVFLDYESKNTYQVRLKASDGVYDTIRVFTISVTDANDIPESVRLSNNIIETDMPGGTTVGRLVAYDQDETDEHSFHIIEGDQYFFINGDELKILNPLIFDHTNSNNNFYEVLIEVDDGNEGIKQETLTVEIVLFKDEEKPTFQPFGEKQVYLNQGSDYVTLSISAKDNIQIDTVYFYYRPIRSGSDVLMEPDSIEIEYESLIRANITVNIGSEEFDEMGIEYYFKAIDAAGNVDSTNTGYVHKSFINLPFNSVNKSFNGDAASYRIIANPYSVESEKASIIFSDYPASTKDSWRLYSYENNQLKEIGNATGSLIKQGHGYWFNKVRSLNNPIVFESAGNPQNHRENELGINLNQGWNMIGNPYPFQLDLENILIRNGLEDGDLVIQTFNGNYNEVKKLNVFEGAFVYTDKARPIVFPVLENPLSGNRIAKSNDFENGWLLELSLDNGEISNNLGGLGMHENAHASYDKYDRPLLPRFINHLDISFNHPEHHSASFSKDVVQNQENYIWEFVASTNMNNRNVEMKWDSKMLNNANENLFLYDVNHDKLIDSKLNQTYAFNLENPVTFKAIYGDQKFIEEAIDKIKIEALKAYPNPFSNKVCIPVNLPFSNETYSVECHIFNLMGDQVFEQNMENLPHGLYQIDWNESEQKNIEQGIYIYSIKVKNGFITNDFHGRIVKN